MRFLLSLVLWLSSASLLANEVCVRNYLKPSGNPCELGTGRHFYVKPAIADEQICALAYVDAYCESSPREFRFVARDRNEAREGSICVVDFHQPPVSDFCFSHPDLYNWAVAN